MFGIGLPEMIVILAVALIVVGPDKLPELARSLAKGVVELKRTMNQLKHSLSEEGDSLKSIEQDIHSTTKDIKDTIIDGNFQEFNREDLPDFPPKKEQEPAAEQRPWEADRPEKQFAETGVDKKNDSSKNIVTNEDDKKDISSDTDA